MSGFEVKTKVLEYDKITEFRDDFKLYKGDVIFTERFLYEKFMQDILDCRFVFLDDYGLGEPNDIVIDKILQDIYGEDIERIIGIGGGSIIDISKLLTVKNARITEDIFQEKIPLVRDKKLILIPTTCGTGSEVTCVSVVDMTKQDTKVGKGIEANYADYAVLIEELLTTIPEKVFLDSSVDALIHAMEIFVAGTSNPYNDLFCEKAIKMIVSNYRKLVENGLTYKSKVMKDFLRASNFAGIALANTVCGAVHALAMHFGSVHHVSHGEANYRFLFGVFNKYVEKAPYGKLAELSSIINEVLEIDVEVDETFIELEKLLAQINPKKRIREYGMKREDIEIYVDKVVKTQKRLLVNNYVPLTKSDLVSIYESVY